MSTASGTAQSSTRSLPRHRATARCAACAAFFDLYGEPTEPVELGRGIRIDRLPQEEAELVMNACTARGHYFVPVRQFSQVYSFVRDLDPTSEEARAFRWDDAEGTLYDALSLSRLVRDNGYSTQYAARITDDEDGEQRVMYASESESKFVCRLSQIASGSIERREPSCATSSQRTGPPTCRPASAARCGGWSGRAG